LWGNPSFACACLLGEAFRDEGWGLTPGRGQITGLPQHFYKEGGESVAKPCAEILLTEHDAEFLLENGLIPVASMKDQDSILLPRIQSIADPTRALRDARPGKRRPAVKSTGSFAPRTRLYYFCSQSFAFATFLEAKRAR
jgi:predicted component of type VI protein secretion system